jgi:hypothetical protein
VLGALRAGQGQGPGTQLAGEQPGEVTGAEAQTSRKAFHALALDQPVGDQAHGTTGDVGRHVPLR